jgi:hypothetical protein
MNRLTVSRHSAPYAATSTNTSTSIQTNDIISFRSHHTHTISYSIIEGSSCPNYHCPSSAATDKYEDDNDNNSQANCSCPVHVTHYDGGRNLWHPHRAHSSIVFSIHSGTCSANRTCPLCSQFGAEEHSWCTSFTYHHCRHHHHCSSCNQAGADRGGSFYCIIPCAFEAIAA